MRFVDLIHFFKIYFGMFYYVSGVTKSCNQQAHHALVTSTTKIDKWQNLEIEMNKTQTLTSKEVGERKDSLNFEVS